MRAVNYENRSICVEALQYVDHLPYRSGMHRLTMLEMAMFCNRETLEIFPSQKTLARKLMVGTRRVRKLISELETDKLLHPYTRGKTRGGRDTNGYEIVGFGQFLDMQRETALAAWEQGKADLEFRFAQEGQSGSTDPVQSGSLQHPNNKTEDKRIKGSNKRGRANGKAHAGNGRLH